MLSSLKHSLSSQTYIFTLFLFLIHEILPTFVIVNNKSSFLLTCYFICLLVLVNISPENIHRDAIKFCEFPIKDI